MDLELDRNLYDAFRLYDAPGTLHVEVNDSAQILGAARLEEPGLHAGRDGASKLNALGYQRALSDIPYTALWSTSSVREWRPALQTEFFNSCPERFRFDTQDRIEISPQKGSTQGNTVAGRQAFENLSGGSRSLIGVQFSYELIAPASWQGGCEQFDGNWGFLAAPWTLNATGVTQTGAVHLTFAATQKLGFYLYYNAAGATYTGETDAAYLRITNLRVVSSTTNRVSTTLSANRAAGASVTATVGSTAGMYVGMQLVMNTGSATSEMITVSSITSSTQFVATFVNSYTTGQTVQGHQVYADEIARDVVSAISAVNSTQLSSATSGITSPARDLVDAVYEDQAADELLTTLAATGNSSNAAYEWGVDDFRRLFFRVQGARAQTWYVDIDALDLSRSLDGLYNSGYAVYEDAGGTPVRSAVSTNSASVLRYGVTRRQAISVQTTDSTYATGVRDTTIASDATVQPRASFTVRAVYNVNGARFPIGWVRANDIVVIRNLPPTASANVDTVRTFRISRTVYNPLAGTLQIEPEAPDPTLEALVGGQV